MQRRSTLQWLMLGKPWLDVHSQHVGQFRRRLERRQLGGQLVGRLDGRLDFQLGTLGLRDVSARAALGPRPGTRP